MTDYPKRQGIACFVHINGIYSRTTMKLHNVLTRFTARILILAAASFGGASLIHAQTVGLQTKYRLVSTDAPGELRVDTGFAPSLTPLINSDTNSGTKFGSSTSSSISVSNYYGNMSVIGSGSSVNSDSQGSFAWVDGGPFTHYEDYIKVTSSTLAVGTDVTIGFTDVFAGSSTKFDPLDPVNISFADNLSVWCYDTTDQFNVSLTGTGSESDVFHTKVGDTVILNGQLIANNASADSNPNWPYNSPGIYPSNFSFSASDALSITSVTDGVDLVSGSGASYAPAGSVPDRASTAWLLAIGLAMVLFCSRSARVIVR